MIKYIKLFSQDNPDVILGVEKLNEPVFIKFQEKHQCLLICPEKEAQGVMSANGGVKYQLENKQSIPSDEDLLVASFIDEIDYETLSVSFDDPKEDVPDEIEDNEKESYMTAAQMRLRIKELTEELSKEKERNDMLEECIIEMSEIVYA